MQPGQKACSMCPATFTRKTHLDRHIRSHMNERTYHCETCEFQFTRSDLLARHKKTCGERRSRRKSCEACVKAKVKCNLQHPCQKCIVRGITCEFTNDPATMRNKLGAVRTRRRAGSTSSRASTSTGATTPEDSGPTTPPPDSMPNPVPDIVNSSNLISPSPSPSCDALAAFAQLGVGNSTLSNLGHPLVPRINFTELTSDFMQTLEINDINDMVMAATFDFETFTCIQSSVMHEDSEAQSPDDTAFGDVSELLLGPPSSAPPGDFMGFDSPSNSVSVLATPRSGISSEHVSEYSHFAPPIPATKLFSNEADHAGIASDDALRVYLYLFFSAFLPQLPVVHEATWREDDKPQVLIRVMQACGALFVRTKTAMDFVAHVLTTARVEIAQEYACKMNDPHGQMYLILALALLQTLGLSNQDAHERGVANVYHGMLKMMITQSRLQETVQAWTPPEFYDDTPVEEAWQTWAYCEMVKRICCLERLHDCAQVVFFCMPSPLDLVFDGYLPCDDALWNAHSAQDWVTCLRTSSHYGSPASRLRGARAQSVLAAFVDSSPPSVTTNLPVFAHYFIIHVLIACIYSHIHACTWSPTQSSSNTGDTGSSLEENHVAQHSKPAYILQNALQNWLANWQDEANQISFSMGSTSTDVSLLPYYRLAQVSLLVLCDTEGAPWHHGPFNHQDAGTEVRFLAFTEWIKQMRGRFQMAQSDPSPADLREDLMKLCILYAHAQVTNGDLGMAADPVDGLLTFFLVPRN
ncbi:hypothetical protein BYT27DRAFT_7243474 [Phlegmacium glaucopus]|nr:hypothetical protein BYT27DRAFT_7243474 [Phlegmacium glaucopus]